ncbi:MAG: ABC transporter substrate-binding protein [Acidimicrobiales bacterium]
MGTTSSVPRCWSAVVGVLALLSALGGPVQGARLVTAVPPRDKTLYTSGTATAPPTDFNPLDPDRAYTGTQGLLYEPLFLFDPVHDKFIPWLATSGSWVSATTYRLQLRGGVDWVASRTGAVEGALTAGDVAYSINLAATDGADPFHIDAASVQKATAEGGAVTVDFKKPVGYGPWQEFLWHAPVLPAALWSQLAPGSEFGTANLSPVSTGPMLLGTTSPSGACYRDNSHWWGKSQLRLSFRFEYLCAVVSGSSGAELSGLLEGRTDWSNELLRGIPHLATGRTGGYDIKTYYPGTPYMLPASTAWLEMDTARSPMANVDFRRAVAYALDPKTIAASVYTGAVTVANPTGLLPGLGAYVDKAAVGKYGFFYSVAKAKKWLAESGYRGQQVTLEVASEWTDQVNAATAISLELAKAGIHASVVDKPIGERDADVADGDYDMVIDSGPAPSSTPWTYFDSVYRLPLQSRQQAGFNDERYSDPAAWALVQQAAATPPYAAKAAAKIYAQLEADFLQALPEIPLWYSGAWFQANTSYWQGYPSSTSPHDEYTPLMWPGWLGSMTTVYALAQLEPR